MNEITGLNYYHLQNLPIIMLFKILQRCPPSLLITASICPSLVDLDLHLDLYLRFMSHLLLKNSHSTSMKFTNTSCRTSNNPRIFRRNITLPSTNLSSWNPAIWFDWLLPIFPLCNYQKGSIEITLVLSKWLNASAFKYINLPFLHQCVISMTYFISHF